MPKYFTGVYAATQVLSNPTTDNPATVTSAGIIAVVNADGIYGTNAAAWQLTNFGQIADAGTAGSGVHLTAGGSVTNGASGSSGGLITGGVFGVFIAGNAGTIVNFGTIDGIAAANNGVRLNAGGNVTNGASAAAGALITGATGIKVYGAAGTVTNFATITGTASYAAAVYLAAGGGVTNQQGGLLQAPTDGVLVGHSSGTVVNYGSIEGSGTNGIGVNLTVAGSTLTNAGTIVGASGTAVRFAGANNRLIVDPGAVFSGIIDGGGGAGSLANNGVIEIGSGARLALAAGATGSGSIAFAGPGGTLEIDNANLPQNTIAGFAPGDTIDLAKTQATSLVYSPGTLTVMNGGSVVGSLALSGRFAQPDFALAPDGNGGTAIGLAKLAYMTGSYNPWGIAATDPGSPETAMNSAFGAGNWTKFQGFTATPLTAGYKFLYIDGGDGVAGQFVNFISANIAALQAFVAGGGELFINAARNGSDANLNLGFGATLEGYNFSRYGRAIDVTNPIFQGPVGVAGTSWFGNYFSHDIVVGNGLNPVITGTHGVNLAGEHYGSGYVMFGGMTAPFFQGPQPQADNLRANILDFIAGDGYRSALFSGTYLNGIVLSNPTTENPATVAAGGYVTNQTTAHSGDAVYGTNAAAWRFTNLGTITTAATAGNADGIFFRSGGNLANSGIIAGAAAGVSIAGAAGQVVNTGTIEASGTGASGVILSAGGAVVNGAVVAAALPAAAAGPGASALIEGSGNGVTITNLAGSVANYGTIISTGSFNSAVFVGGGGNVTNGASGAGAALIDGQWVGVDFKTVAGTVANFGTIESGASFSQPGSLAGVTGTLIGVAVLEQQGGLVINGAPASPDALISGYALGVYIGGGAGMPQAGAVGTIVNYGTIASIGTNGVAAPAAELSSGGTIVNHGVIESAASDGIRIKGTVAATVSNFGTVASLGVTSGRAVDLSAGGLLTNYGLLTGAANGDPTAGYTGVVRARDVPATVANYGTITNPNNSNGVNLLDGGLVINGSTQFTAALINAPHTAIYIGGTLGTPTPGAVGTVVNYGTIQNTTSLSAAVRLVSGGLVTNHGLIASARTGISFGFTAGTVDNFATIVSTASTSFTAGSGIYLQSGGLITNEAGGLVSALRAAVSLGTSGAAANLTNRGSLTGNIGISINAADTGNNTIDNFGVITGTGGTAISLGGGADLVVVEDGSTLSGAIANFTSADTLDLASVPFSASDTLAFDGTNLTVSGGGVSETVGLAGLPAQTAFLLGNDGSGGTDVTLAMSSGAVVSAGEVLTVGSGQTLSNVMILSGGTLEVGSGGTVVGATIGSGGEEVVLSGGVDSGATISSGGFEEVFGSAVGTMVANGGSQTVEAGGSVTGAVLDGVGLQTVFGFAGGTVVGAGDEQLVEAGGVASGTVISSGGLEVVLSGGATSDTVIAGGELELSDGAAATGAIAFSGSGGELLIEGQATPAATVGGFAAGDVLDERAIGFAAGDTATLDQNDLLTVSGGGASVSLQFDSSVAGKGFALSDDGSGGVKLTLTPQAATRLFDFVFVYNDGQDYYLGTVADDGRFGYAVGQTKATSAGSYIVFGQETAATGRAAGSVFVTDYSHGGPGAASGIPIKTAAGNADGNAGLGSESDMLLGVDGQPHPFSSTAEAAFPTTPLFGFVFTYADGASYSGTVAGSQAVQDEAGVLGVYTIFSDGVTARASGTVVIDRFQANGASIVVNHAGAGAVDGTAGLGSEAGSVTVGQVAHSFSPTSEPVVTGIIQVVSPPAAPAVSQVIASEVDGIFYDILGRAPSPSEFLTDSGALGGGTSAVDVRAALAATGEAQSDLEGLYQQIFGRAAAAGELSAATGDLTDGSSLASLQQVLANSSEAAGDINQIYLDVLGRAADAGGLASFTAALGNETPGNLTDPGGLSGIAGVRDVLAHSGEAQEALTNLFDDQIGRAPSTAELVGMEDQLAIKGNTEASLQSALRATGSAGGFTTIAAPGGNATLSAAAAPSLFTFSDIAFNDTITGFDAARDTIELPNSVAPDFTTIQSDTKSASGGSLITLNPNQSIFLAGVAPNKLAAGNFLLS